MIQNNRKFVLVGLGEILWDLLPQGRQLGGAPANFAYHAQALGAEGVVVSCIGNDRLGQEITDRLKRLALDVKYIAADSRHPTGTVTVELDERGKPDYIIHENVAWDFIPSNPHLLELAARADAVCFGSLCQRSEVSRTTIREFLKATRPECLRVFDINLRQAYFSEEVVHSMLRIAAVLKLNDDELPVVAELLGLSGSEDDILRQLTDKYGLRMIALTKGPRGSRLLAGSQDSKQQSFPGKVVDTVGAGDSFSAAITLGLLYGEPLDKINEFANHVAGFVCSRPGATPNLPQELANHYRRENTADRY